MKRLLFIISAVAVAILSACENDIDADIENLEGVLCLNAYLVTGADTNFVHVSRTSRTSPAPVTEARIELRVNGNLVETVTDCYKITYVGTYYKEVYDDFEGWTQVEETGLRTDTIFGTYMLTKKFDVGDNVRVDVFSGGQHVWAEDVAPRKIENPTVSHTYTHRPYNTNYSKSEMDVADLEIGFDDISGGADFYRMAIYSDYYVEQCHYERFEPWLYGLYSEEEIMNYARKNFDHPIFKDEYDLEVYYIERKRYQTERNYVDYGYRGCLILSEGESQSSSSDEDDDSSLELLTTDVENTYRVFSDNLFNNSTARLTAKVWCPYKVLDYTNHKFDEEYLTDEENALAGIFYNWRLTVKLQSISEQQYYYLRAMNAISSSAYDELSNLTGAMKVPTNVHGGSGNFSVSTQTTVELTVIDNYKPQYDVNANENLW